MSYRDKGLETFVNVAFFIYRRADLTRQVFGVIAAAKPDRLLVVADGPRDEKEVEMCKETRRVVMEHVSWPCEVIVNFSEINMGCKKRMSSGLDWVFNIVDNAIILEDDCLPDPSFFPYCQELLDRYSNDARFGSISGENIFYLRDDCRDSYFIARFGSIWGWATWRRAWMCYDVNMSQWPTLRGGDWLRQSVYNKGQAITLGSYFDETFDGKVDTWDTQWGFAHLLNNFWTVIPTVNLISNIGFGENATHTTGCADTRAGRITCKMEFPLKHPHILKIRNEYDKKYLSRFYSGTRSPLKRLSCALRNKYLYGEFIRKIPFLGNVWVKIRNRIKEQ